MLKLPIQRTSRRMAENLVQQTTNKSPKYFDQEGNYNLALRKQGKAIVPIYPSTHIAKRNSKKINTAEKREDPIEIFEQAAMAEPMVWRSILLIAKWVVAWGFQFGFLNRFQKRSKTDEKTNNALEFFENWAEYVFLTFRIFQIVIQMILYGDGFVEKIYDDNGSYLKDPNSDGWGIRHLKIIHPRTIGIERDEYGRIERYWQKPPNYMGRNIDKIKKLGGIPLDPTTIIHFKWNDFRNMTYGTSDLKPLIDVISMKVGMREDAAIMVQQRSNPIVVWLVGDMENPPPAGFLSASADYLSTSAGGTNDLVLPGFMKPEVIGTGTQMPDITPYLGMMSSEIIKGIGVPEVLLGEGNETTEATARIQIESFTGDIMYLQNFVGDVLRKHCFYDMVDPPERKREDRTELKNRDYVGYKMFKTIPSMRFNPLVNIIDLHDINVKLYDAGLGGTEEIRDRLGFINPLDKEDISPNINAVNEQIKNEARALDIQVDQMNSQERMAKEQVKAQKAQPQAKPAPAKAPVKKTQSQVTVHKFP